MKTITIGARISEELDRDLRKLTAATVEQGIKAADEGRLVEHEAVVAEFERRYRSR